MGRLQGRALNCPRGVGPGGYVLYCTYCSHGPRSCSSTEPYKVAAGWLFLCPNVIVVCIVLYLVPRKEGNNLQGRKKAVIPPSIQVRENAEAASGPALYLL